MRPWRNFTNGGTITKKSIAPPSCNYPSSKLAPKKIVEVNKNFFSGEKAFSSKNRAIKADMMGAQFFFFAFVFFFCFREELRRERIRVIKPEVLNKKARKRC